MLYVYMCLAAILIPLLDRFLPILQKGYSIWLVPLLFIGFFIAFILLHAAVFIISLLLIRADRPLRCKGYYRGLAKVTLPSIAKLIRIKLDITGEDLIPADSRFVIIGNHTSVLDPVVLMAAFPQCEFAFMAKEETKKMPIVWQFIISQGGVFVDRESTRSGAKALIDMINLLKADKASVGIFPEGTRSKNGELLPFKPGAVRMAAKAGVPLVVCTIKGTADVFKNLPFKSTRVKIDILKTYTKEEIQTSDHEGLQNAAREMMKENLEKK